jgi:hypothetical protein
VSSCFAETIVSAKQDDRCAGSVKGREMNKHRGVCYLCGKEGTVTDDHVPPHCLAPKADNSVFYILPTHRTCNNALSHHESRFRDYVVAYAKDGVPEAEDAFEKMQRNFVRGKEGGSLNQDYYRLFDNIVFSTSHIGAAQTPSGLLISPFVGIKPPKDLDYRAVLLKIARGLHYYHTQEIIPDNSFMMADFVVSDWERHIASIQRLNIAGQMGDFFAYKGTWARDEPKSGIWYMIFYRSLVGVASFSVLKELG